MSFLIRVYCIKLKRYSYIKEIIRAGFPTHDVVILTGCIKNAIKYTTINDAIFCMNRAKTDFYVKDIHIEEYIKNIPFTRFEIMDI